MTKDQLIAEHRAKTRRGTLPGLVVMYGAIIGTLIGTAAVMTS